jgi:hypothetical protein
MAFAAARMIKEKAKRPSMDLALFSVGRRDIVQLDYVSISLTRELTDFIAVDTVQLDVNVSSCYYSTWNTRSHQLCFFLLLK